MMPVAIMAATIKKIKAKSLICLVVIGAEGFKGRCLEEDSEGKLTLVMT